jgi:hypothetical protein
MTNPNGFVTVDRYLHPTDAYIAAGRLESEGIPVNLVGINHASVNWLITNALGGIRLQVPHKFASEARSILATAAPIEVSEKDSDRCPACGASNTTVHSTAWKISFLVIHLLNIPIPWGKGRRQCDDCGHEWRPGDA